MRGYIERKKNLNEGSSCSAFCLLHEETFWLLSLRSFTSQYKFLDPLTKPRSHHLTPICSEGKIHSSVNYISIIASSSLPFFFPSLSKNLVLHYKPEIYFKIPNSKSFVMSYVCYVIIVKKTIAWKLFGTPAASITK